MIPNSRTPEILEFMTGYVVDTYSSNDDVMNVYIPLIMMDRKASNITSNLPITNIFVNGTKINTSSSVVSQNYIPAKVSPLFKLIHPAPDKSTITKGTKVNIYCPLLDLDQATIVALQ